MGYNIKRTKKQFLLASQLFLLILARTYFGEVLIFLILVRTNFGEVLIFLILVRTNFGEF